MRRLFSPISTGLLVIFLERVWVWLPSRPIDQIMFIRRPIIRLAVDHFDVILLLQRFSDSGLRRHLLQKRIILQFSLWIFPSFAWQVLAIMSSVVPEIVETHILCTRFSIKGLWIEKSFCFGGIERCLIIYSIWERCGHVVLISETGSVVRLEKICHWYPSFVG